MNPYKKIERLQKQIDQLKEENKEYKYNLANVDKIQKLAEERYDNYCKLVVELEKSKQQYDKLIHQLKYAIKQQPKTYKAFDKEFKKTIK